MKKLLLILLLSLLANIAVADTLKIGIKPASPFAYKVDGEWYGLSVDLLKKLSNKLWFDYEFVEVETVTALLGLVEDNAVDLSIAAISMTDDREQTVDFSHPYFVTTQGILTASNGNVFWFISQKILIAFAALIAIFYLLGFIVSRLDPEDEINNIHKGAWFILVTFTTTGYGDFVPRNARAKVFAGFIMLISLFGLSGFTAYVTSAITIDKLTDDIVTVADLHGKKVAAIGGTTTSKLLDLLDIKHELVASVGTGVDLVKKGKVKAFVYDKAMLDFLVKKEDNNSLVVHPINRGQERYAIAFPQGSNLREDFNVAILDTIDSTEWRQISTQYFGNH